VQLYEQHKDLIGSLSSSPEITLLLALAKNGRDFVTTEAPRALL